MSLKFSMPVDLLHLALSLKRQYRSFCGFPVIEGKKSRFAEEIVCLYLSIYLYIYIYIDDAF